MNENENNFDALRQLLSLKRHEVPPPGYFNRFSGQVIARIRAGEREAETATPWYLRFMQMFEMKPAFASSFAGALCLLLVFGIVYAEQSDQTPQSSLLQTSQLSPGMLTASATPVSMPQSGEQNIFADNSFSNSAPSSLQPMFGNNTFVQPVSFNFSH